MSSLLQSISHKHNLQFVMKNVAMIYIRTPSIAHYYIANMANQFVTTQWHKDLTLWWHYYIHWHRTLVLRDEQRILNQKLDFGDDLWCFAIFIYCFEKCTYCSVNVKNDLKNATKQGRKAVNVGFNFVSCCRLFYEQLTSLYYRQHFEQRPSETRVNDRHLKQLLTQKFYATFKHYFINLYIVT